MALLSHVNFFFPASPQLFQAPIYFILHFVQAVCLFQPPLLSFHSKNKLILNVFPDLKVLTWSLWMWQSYNFIHYQMNHNIGECSHMRSKVLFDWLPHYIKAEQIVLERCKMAQYFLNRPHIYKRQYVKYTFQLSIKRIQAKVKQLNK